MRERDAASVPLPHDALLALQQSAGNRAVSGALLQRTWNDERVYTVVRELIPSFKQRLRPELFAMDVRERLAHLERLTAEIDHELREAVGGRYRLARTEDFAIGAVETLQALRGKAAAARDATREMVRPFDEALDRTAVFERIDALLQAVEQERVSAGATPARGPGEGPEKGLREARETLATEAVVKPEKLVAMDDTFAIIDEWAITQRRLLATAREPLERYVERKVDIESDLEQIDDRFKTYEKASVKGRKEMQNEREALGKRFAEAVKRGEQARGLATDKDIGVLGNVVNQLGGILKDVGLLGERLEDATEYLKTPTTATRRGQRTSLPGISATDAAALPDHAQMLVPAVKEALKNPVWTRAAEDFTRNVLATGRPDHIHISGGGNTLLYSGRLLLGFITDHLDSRPESQRKAAKVFGRERANPVDVVLDHDQLKEVLKS